MFIKDGGIYVQDLYGSGLEGLFRSSECGDEPSSSMKGENF